MNSNEGKQTQLNETNYPFCLFVGISPDLKSSLHLHFVMDFYIWPFHFLQLQKVHTFQKSLEAVLQRLGEVEIGQKTLENAGNIAGTENEILLFRNQLKVSKVQSWT